MKFIVSILILSLFILCQNTGFANGNKTLGNSYSQTTIGLNYVSASGKMAIRYTPTPGSNPVALNITGIPAGAIVQKAFLYAISGYKGTPPVNQTFTLANATTATVPAVNIGQDGPKCWGETGNATYRADVTSVISGNGVYVASTTLNDTLCDGITLIIIYQDLSATYIGNIVMDDGLIVAIGTNASHTTTIAGTTVPLNANGFGIFSDVQSNVSSTAIYTVNGTNQNIPRLFWNFEKVPITLNSNQTSVLCGTTFAGDCYAWALQGIYYQSTNDTMVFVQPLTDTMYCAGDSMFVNYNVTFSFLPGNIFTVQLSDATGSFANPVNIGTVTSTTSGNIKCKIPANTIKGFGYRIRIVAVNPSRLSVDNGKDISISNVPPSLMPFSNSPVCQGDTIKLTSYAVATTNTAYTWTGPNGFNSTLQNTTVNNPTLSATGSYFIHAVDSFGCVNNFSLLVDVHAPVYAKLSLTKNTFCQYEHIDMQNIASNIPTVINNWQLDTISSIISGDGSPNITASWSSTGTKKALLHVTDGVCHARDSQNVDITPTPKAYVEFFKDGCIGQSINLYPEFQDAYYYWTIDGQYVGDTTYKNPLNFYWSTAGDKRIQLVLKGADGCVSDSFDVKLSIHEGPQAKIELVDKTQICTGDPISFVAKKTNYCVYEWSPQVYFLQANLSEVSASIKTSSMVHLKVTDQWGCNNSDSVFVNTDLCCSIFIPSAFTPNGDGKNDKLHIMKQSGDYILHSFIITDRWGKAVFDTKDKNEGWDGRFKGTPQDENTYYYFIKYNCGGKDIDQSGDVTLIR